MSLNYTPVRVLFYFFDSIVRHIAYGRLFGADNSRPSRAVRSRFGVEYEYTLKFSRGPFADTESFQNTFHSKPSVLSFRGRIRNERAFDKVQTRLFNFSKTFRTFGVSRVIFVRWKNKRTYVIDVSAKRQVKI